MDRVTRKELKGDRFAEEVGHTVEYVGLHKKAVIRYGSIVVVVVVAVIAIVSYLRHQNLIRQTALNEALTVQQASVGQQGNEFALSFPTEEARNQAAVKAFTEVLNKYPSSEQGMVSCYYLGILAADKGDLPAAEKYFKMVADEAGAVNASLAKLALAQIYGGEGKVADAEKLLRELMDKPSVFVSKEQAIITLAQILGPTRPEEARKLLEPLKNSRPAVSRAAIVASGDINR